MNLSYVALWRSCSSCLQITLKAFNGIVSLSTAVIRSCSGDRLSSPYCLATRSMTFSASTMT
jgi:hypothetical protein